MYKVREKESKQHMSTLSDRLRQIRNEQGISQQDVAKHLGISRPTYSQYETESRNPNWHTIARLANFFHVSSDYLIGRTDDKNAVLSGEFAVLSDEQIKLLHLFQQFSHVQKSQFFGYAERVLEDNSQHPYSTNGKTNEKTGKKTIGKANGKTGKKTKTKKKT